MVCYMNLRLGRATPVVARLLIAAAMLLALPGQARAQTHQVDLTWTAASTATSYNVYRSIDDVTWVKLTSAPVASTSYLDANPNDGTMYYYWVTSINASGENTTRNEVNGGNWTKVFIPPLNPITNFKSVLIAGNIPNNSMLAFVMLRQCREVNEFQFVEPITIEEN